MTTVADTVGDPTRRSSTHDNHRMRVDTVTVCFCEELGLLKLQASSIDRFFDPRFINRVFVINNDPEPERFASQFYEEVLPLYGRKADSVVLLDHRQFRLPAGLRADGWRSQQLLKLAAHRCVETDFYLVLDAKNHALKHVGAENLCPHRKPRS